MDATGKLVVHVFDNRRAHLSADYGVVMCHSADGWVLFTIADKAKNSVGELREARCGCFKPQAGDRVGGVEPTRDWPGCWTDDGC